MDDEKWIAFPRTERTLGGTASSKINGKSPVFLRRCKQPIIRLAFQSLKLPDRRLGGFSLLNCWGTAFAE
jgi:hypothetical protein